MAKSNCKSQEENIKVIDINLDKIEITLFSVTGRIYQVNLNPSVPYVCTCPYQRQHPTQWCKHILFVLLRLYQKTINPNDMESRVQSALRLGPLMLTPSQRLELFVTEEIQTQYRPLLEREKQVSSSAAIGFFFLGGC